MVLNKKANGMFFGHKTKLKQNFMKKFILSAILIVSAVIGMNAQDVALSINAGVGTSTWVGDHSSGTSPRFAYRVGLGVDMPIQGRFGFRTGVNFEQIGTNVDTKDIAKDLDTRYGFLHIADNTKAYNIALFFNVGYKF